MRESRPHGEMGHEEHEQEKPEMNLLTNLDKTLRAIAKVEFGEREEAANIWVEQQLKKDKEGRHLEYTAGAALDHLERLDPEMKRRALEKIEAGQTVNACCSIYGADAINRYMVLPNGEVQFSEFHATYWDKEEVMNNVRKAGFKIFH